MNKSESPFVPFKGLDDPMKDALMVIKVDQTLIKFNKLAKKLFPEFNIEACIINLNFPLMKGPVPQLVQFRTMKRISGKNVCVESVCKISKVANLTAKKLLAFHMESVVNSLINEFTNNKKRFTKNRRVR